MAPWTYQQLDEAGKLGIDGFIWIAFGMKKIYACWDEDWHNVTRQDEDGNDVDYTTREGTNWDVTQSGALLIATNGADAPQILPLNEKNKVVIGVRMEDMSSWVDPETNTPGETDLNCQTLEGFKNHIIATSIQRRTTGESVSEDLSRLVKWSTQHGHYEQPKTWDVTNKNHDAGEYELLDTQGPIIDTLPMGELFMIYKSDSVYMMSFVGTPYMFSFKTLDPQIGVIAKGATAEFPGGHFFVSFSDCYINNGQSVTPIVNW